MGSIPVRVIFCLLEVVRKLVGCDDCHARPCLTTTLLAGNNLNEENCDQTCLYDDLKNKNVNFALPLDCVNFFGGQRPERKKNSDLSG